MNISCEALLYNFFKSFNNGGYLTEPLLWEWNTFKNSLSTMQCSKYEELQGLKVWKLIMYSAMHIDIQIFHILIFCSLSINAVLYQSWHEIKWIQDLQAEISQFILHVGWNFITHFSYLFLHAKLPNVKIFPAETPIGSIITWFAADNKE
jgi:hypothetical protein